MTAPLTPEAFLARVREAASSAAQAVAEFLTAVEDGCSEREIVRSGEIAPVTVFVRKWQGAVEPDCLRAMESSEELLNVLNPPPPGEPPNITASYTPPETLPQHAAMLRGTYRTAVNVIVTLSDIMARLQTHQPWIDPGEIVKLGRFREALRSYGDNADRADDNSIQPRVAAAAKTATEEPAQLDRSPLVGAESDEGSDQTPVMLPAHHRAYQSFERAIKERPDLAEGTDREVYDWLAENDPDPDHDYELPAFETWARYVREARKALNRRKNTPRYGRAEGSRSIVSVNSIR